ncbi:AsnC family transcriptional regulator [Halomicrobium salinisoli]|uniref:AsnC family transcriptional regulator n=1 Tax=Halomicrobium salinisoli TaxID=2878391 RepID=UPI001CF060BB|nr:AsnC family transcriptional regulator [Halomicrobium salinisoli]
MDGLDDTDREILGLLLEDARRPYNEIGEAVDLSGPAVADRIDRLRERGLIEGFTVELDRSMLREGVHVFVSLDVDPTAAERVADALAGVDAVEHVFRSVDARVTFTATVPDGDVTALLGAHDLLEDVREYEVRVLADAEWTPGLGDAELAPECAECGNSVDAEGTSATLDSETYYFCCASCESRFVEQYEELREGA